MLLHVPEVLRGEPLAHCRAILDHTDWADGRITAGTQSAEVKRNLQLPENAPASRAAREIVLGALGHSALFFAAALPARIFPPLFNCYRGASNSFGDHIDNAVRTEAATGQRVRTDLAVTLFLSDPDEYEGGELTITDTWGTRQVKLAAGDLVLYPATSVHRVEPVTHGARIASFFWLQSMVRDETRRRTLFDLDMAILDLRERVGDIEPVVKLTGTYHNLLRMWAEL
jgi:PKHD-type hydroxylase